MDDLAQLLIGQVSYRQPDNENPESQEENEFEKREEFAPERGGFSVEKCH
jgi:hypothetical protein